MKLLLEASYPEDHDYGRSEDEMQITILVS